MKALFGLAMAAAVLAGCGGNVDGTNNLPTRRGASPAEVDKASKTLQQGKSARIAEESNAFGFKLLAELVGQKSKTEKGAEPAYQSALVSPLGISMCLAMAYNGAAKDTKTGMDKALGFDGLLLSDVNEAEKQLLTVFSAPDPKVQTEIANSLWAKKGIEFKKDYFSRIQENFGAAPTVLDFSGPDAAKQINAWVSQATQEKIRELVKEIPEDTVMFLINAVYFKGFWKTPFDPKVTEERDFAGFDGKKAKVQMMSRKGEFEYAQSDKARVVRMPYGSGRLAMLAVLPPEGGSYKALSKELNPKNWAAWTASLKPQQGTVMIPRFKMDYQAVLNDPLTTLGMGQAFTDKADFSGMREPNDLYIKQVLHKTTIEVNEEGSEAAAATKVEVGITSAPAPTKEFMFLADRPFFYAIVDKTTGVILFMGVYGDPR
ncbi:MAG: serpin family protein [Armatimonadetes bacterium]|nr:serpin family protein [Armatimonadota bacterium]